MKKTKQLLTAFMLAVMVMSIMPISNVLAGCPIVALPGNGSTSGNARAPIGNFRYERGVYLITAAELAAAGFASGQNIGTIQWTYFVAHNISVSGNLQVWFENTSDVTSTKSTTWATAVSTMSNAHNAAATIPAGTVFDVTLTGTPFTYTGGGIYVGFEWSNASNPLSTGASVLCTNQPVAAMLNSQQSNISLPVTLAAASNFRPQTVISAAGFANDAQAGLIYTYGSLPNSFTVGHQMQARVTNAGNNTLTNLNVSLNITGANTFSDVQIVPSIPPCSSAIVTFNGFTPTGTGNNTVTVSVPSDDNNGNNTSVLTQPTTSNIYSYKYSSPLSGGVGFNAGIFGVFVSKFNAGIPALVNEVKVDFQLGTAPRQFRIAIYDELGGAPNNLLFVSPSVINITAAAQQAFIPISPSVAVTGNFFVGVVQETTNTANIGFSYQSENPVRAGIFYYANAISGGPWVEFSSAALPFRSAIEVQFFVPQPPNCAIYNAPADLSFACQNGTTLTWASGGGGPTGYKLSFGTNAPNYNNILNQSDLGLATSYPTGALTPGTTYGWKVEPYNVDGAAIGCSGRTFTTNLVSCYCASTATNGAFEFISNVATGAFSNPSISNLYSNYLGLGSINTVAIGGTFNLDVTISTPFDEDRMYIYIDINQDGDFSDVDELVANVDVISAQTLYTVPITVPIASLAGNTVMRIKMGDETVVPTISADPCQASFFYGEVEDYLINLSCGSSITATTPACENGVMNFQANYSGNSTPFTYVWSGPNGFISGISNPSIPSLTLADGGTYIVTVTDAAACSSTSSVTFAVSPAPVVNVSSNTPVCVGNNISLTSSGGVSYIWSGPNGFNDVAQNPTVNPTTLASAGAYTVTVTDAFGCTASGTENVSVNSNPVLNIVSQTDVGCTGGNDGAFTIGATGNNPFLFDENGNINFDGIFTNYSAGAYIVDVTDANSCSASIPVAVGTTSSAPPANSATIISLPLSACVGQTVPVSCNAIIGATGYTWSTPVGTLINGLPSPQTTVSPNVNITLGALPANSSSWLICVFGANGCGQTNTNCKPIRGSLSIPSTIVGSNVACENTSGIYSVNAVGGANSYLWTGTNGITFSGSGISITANFPNGFTTGTICVAGQLACGYTGPSRCMTVNNSIPSLGGMTGTFSICPGQNGVAFSVPPANGAATYTWTPPAGVTIATGAGTNAITVNIGPGFVSGLMCVTATTSCGAVSAARCNTVAATLPNTPGNISGAVTGICGQTITYSVPSVIGVSYTWTAPAGASLASPNGINTIDVTYPGNFTTGQLCVTANNACGASAPRCVNSKGSPSNPGVIAGNNAVCANDAGINYSIAPVFGATGYVWTVPFGATIVSGQGTTSINVDWGTNGGTIGVTAQSPCGNSGTRTLAVSMNCKLSANALPGSSLNVYPNPVSTLLNVELTTMVKGNYSLELFDLSGRLVYQNQVSAIEGFNQLTLDVSGYVKGMYLLSVKDASGFTQQVRVGVE